MSETKGSGLRQPSKIGRPCCTVQPKPAVPPSPPRSSMNSMEPIYENVKRKESGDLRRGSDTSVVLTEDTDSFIIGDRVWVGGTKPGSIAYIGETQFAPGDWAGVVLDEPIGKNDGSVAGSRYFQCAPKHGIFSRLTRLTRYPLQESSLTSPSEVKSPPVNKSSSPSLNVSMTSLNSSISHRDFKIGDRVIVSSSQGSKTGVLRFLGTTEFAAGEWCGVELDEAVGKNDGSVGEIRYFECQMKHGLFAPVHKVSRSPSSKRSSICAIHKPSGAALNSSLRKAGSRESLTSLSSVASTTISSRGATTARRPRASTPGQSTLQEMLKEKQQEIEMLRKERDLERERITKAATQADNAEQSIINLKQEYDKYREEMEKNIVETQARLSQLLEEKNNLHAQLDEERQKCEDLLFRFEEESLNKEDIQKEKTAQSVVNIQNEERIKALERELSEERERVMQLERDNIRLFETEEELAKLKTETSIFAELENTNLCLKEAKITLENQMLERNNTITELSSQISELQQKLKNREEVEESNIEKLSEDLRRDIEEKNLLISKITEENTVKIQTMVQEIEKLKEIIENLTKENMKSAETQQLELKKLLMEKENLSLENSKRIADFEKLIMEKSKKIEEENEKSAKVDEKNSELEKSLQNFHIEMNNLKSEIKEKDEKLEENLKLIAELEQKYLTTCHDQKNNTTEIEKLKELLKNNSAENEKLVEKLDNNSGKFVSLNGEIDSLKSQLINKNENIENMMEKIAELNDGITFFEQTKTNLESELKMYESNISELNKKLKFSDEKFQRTILEKEKLEQDISRMISNSEGASEELQKYNEELRIKEKENAKLKETIFELENSLENWKEKLKENEENFGKMTVKIREYEENERKLMEELKKSESHSKSLEETLKENEKNCENLSRKLQNSEADIQKMTEELNEYRDNFTEIQEKLKRSEENCEKLSEISLESTKNIIKIQEKLKETEENSSKIIEAKNLIIRELETKVGNFEENSVTLLGKKEELTQKISELEGENQTLAKKVKHLEKDNEETKESEKNLKLKIEELNEKIKEMIGNLSEENSKFSDVSNTLENTLANYEKSQGMVHELKNEIVLLKLELDSSRENLTKLEKLIQQKEEENTGLSKSLEKLDTSVENYKKSQDTIEALNYEISSLKSILSSKSDESSEKIKELEQALERKNSEIENLNGKLLELTKAEDRLHTLGSEKWKMEGELENLAREKSANEEKLKILETDHENLKNVMNQKSKMIDELVGVLETLKTAETEAIKSVEFEFSQKLKETSDNSSKIMEELKNTKIANETFQMDLLKILEEKERLNKVIENSERKIKELESKNSSNNSEFYSKVQKIEEENSELIREKQKIERKNTEIHSRLSEALEEIKKLKASSNNNLSEKIEQKIEKNGETDNLNVILQENETFKSQIDFLNSVIVDMQKKNETLKLKIEVLEMGVPANEADDYSRETLKKVSTPRMFCDICDEFDLHETEDCPKQSQDFEIEKPVKKTPVKVPIERAYCDHCEIFGHDTADCDDAETF